jgi:hypothetical protein
VGTLLSMIRHGLLDMEPPRGVMRLHANRALADEILEVLVTRARRHREWHDDDRRAPDRRRVRARGRSFLDAWERIIARAARGQAPARTYSDLDRAKHQGKSVMFFATDDPPTTTTSDDSSPRHRCATSSRAHTSGSASSPAGREALMSKPRSTKRTTAAKSDPKRADGQIRQSQMITTCTAPAPWSTSSTAPS